jgi:hypothetical protein
VIIPFACNYLQKKKEKKRKLKYQPPLLQAKMQAE